MLQKGVITATEMLTHELADQGLSLSPLPGSPLAVAVAACHSPYIPGGTVADVDGGETTYVGDYVRKAAEELMKPEPNGVVKHDKLIEDQVRVIATSLRGNFHLAQNVVLPKVMDVYKAVQQKLKDADTNYRLVLKVEPDELGGIWSDGQLLETVEKYRNSLGIGETPIPNVHRPRTNGEVLALLKTGSAGFDKALLDFVASNGADFINQVYQQYFVDGRYDEANIPVIERYTPKLNDFMGTSRYERSRTLTVHFLARKLRENLDEGIDMPADVYDKQMADVIADTGRGIVRVLEKRERDDKGNRLVLSYPYDNAEMNVSYAEGATISVNADVYKRWLASGGRPEILMGAYVVDRNMDYNDLLEKADTYEQAWNRRRAVLLSGQESARFTTALVALRDSVSETIAAVPDDEVPEGGRQPMVGRLAELIGVLKLKDFDDLYVLVRRLTCTVLYPQRQALEILERMDKIASDNPDVDLREVASAAFLDILTDWFADQFVVHRAKA